jgi:hypothetical protein
VLQPTLGSPRTSCGYTEIKAEHVEHSIVIMLAYEKIGSIQPMVFAAPQLINLNYVTHLFWHCGRVQPSANISECAPLCGGGKNTHISSS